MKSDSLKSENKFMRVGVSKFVIKIGTNFKMPKFSANQQKLPDVIAYILTS